VLVNPAGTERVYQAWQYSQAVRVGDTVWVAGQVGSEKGQVQEGIEAQTRAAFRRLERVLQEAGASLDDVVELITYHTDMKDFPKVREVKSEFIKQGFPAWTAVGVTALADPRMLIEIRATAVIGSGRNKQIPGIETGTE
jgi:enamine deaminase RidA (YjgF/YER057c/UK114 family)